MEYILITGVSSGIGYATTKFLLDKGFHIFGSVRSEEDANRLENDFGQSFTALVFDITDHPKIEKEAKKVEKTLQGKNLFGLVNNAGISVPGPLMHIPLEQVKYQMDVNFFGLLKVTQIFLPFLGTDKERKGKPGRIINISSVSGLKSFPFVGPYAASKHALEAISDSLRLELLMYGIKVIVIEPGNVLTPIWDKIPDLSIYKHTGYFPILKYAFDNISRSKKKSLSDRAIAGVIHIALTKVKPKIRYLVIKNKFLNWTFYSLLPDKFVAWLYTAKLKKIQRDEQHALCK